MIQVGLLVTIPLSATMGLIGLFGAALYVGPSASLTAFASETAGFLTNSQVAVLPLFLMMGSFAAVAGISQDIYRLAQALLGWLPGGLALATIGGCAGFGAVTGSSVATVATFGRVSLPEMLGRGYKPSLALGSVAAGGTLGALVPPSTPIILFAILTQASIGQLFIAAIGPALLALGLYFITVLIWTRVQVDSAPPCAKVESGEIRTALRQSLSCFILFGVIIGGLYTGIFTATESAAVGSFGAFALALFRGRLGGGAFWKVLAETITTTATIYSLIFGALIFAFFVGMSSLPEIVVQLVDGLNLAPLTLIAVLLLVYIALGSIMDSFSVMMITVPIVVPLVLGAGYDLIWWGVIMLVVIETGMISPPFGLNVFVLKSVTKNSDLLTIFRGVLPFILADLVKLAILVLVPAVTLWLPSSMY